MMTSLRRQLNTLPDGVATQHTHLSGAIHTLREAWQSDQGWDAISDHLDRLLREVHEHFEYEEILMQRGAYPRFEEHRQQHASFLRRLQALRFECQRQETELLGVLIELLEAWFRSHEQHADRPAIEYLGLED